MTKQAKRILMIDDEKSWDIATVTAKTDEEGLKLLREESWDILVLDNDLACPLEGRTILWMIEQEKRLPNEVVIVSNNGPARDSMMFDLLRWGYVRKYSQALGNRPHYVKHQK